MQALEEHRMSSSELLFPTPILVQKLLRVQGFRQRGLVEGTPICAMTPNHSMIKGRLLRTEESTESSTR